MENDVWLAIRESTLKSSEFAVKTVIMLNGGAVVAILTFFGNFAARNLEFFTGTTAVNCAFKVALVRCLDYLGNGLQLFCTGLCFGALCAGLRYASELAYLSGLEGNRRGDLLALAAIILGILSFLLFLFGLHNSWKGLDALIL